MAYVMAEIAIQRLIQYGIHELRSDRSSFDEIFSYLVTGPLMSNGYGSKYVDKIWEWFTTEKIPVVQAFLLTPERIPCYSVHLSSENEDESKASISDFYGEDEDGDVGINMFTVNIDIGIHGSKVAEQVIWMYYILSDIFFRHKLLAQSMGIQLHTFGASDWQRDNSKNPENIYTRWIKMRLTVSNTWGTNPPEGPYNLEIDVKASSTDIDDPIVETW